jgi:hypothetical protein
MLYNFFQCEFNNNHHLIGLGMPARFREVIIDQILNGDIGVISSITIEAPDQV